jgi:hypothetical protein
MSSFVIHFIIHSDLVRAADIAFQERNIRALEELLVRAGKRPELVEHITSLKDRLEQK